MLFPVQSFANKDITLSLSKSKDVILYVESLKLSLKNKKEDIQNMKYKINGLLKLREQQEKLLKNNTYKIKEISKQLNMYEDLYSLELKNNNNIKNELILVQKNKVVKNFSRTVKSFITGIAGGLILGVFLVK